jgi:exodeoxyribonuclease V alpha subunit
MSAPYSKLGIQSVWRHFSLEATANSHIRFEQQLCAIEAGTAALNLSADSVHLAAEIAAFDPDLNDEDRIGLILLIVISLAALEEGSTRFPVTGAESVEPMRRLLSPLCGESFGVEGGERMRSAITRILNSNAAAAVIGGNPNDYKPLIFLPPYIYQHRTMSAEITLARRLASLISSPATHIDKAVPQNLLRDLTTHSEVFGGRRINLSEEQRVAIEHAVTAPLTVISGGPGTGKTSIVLAILQVLVGMAVEPGDIALAAPTGKAAYRIGQSIRDSLSSDTKQPAPWKECAEPTTVHRLLGYSPTRQRFHHHRNNPLGAHVVIVDEGSMLDLEMMSRLLDAMRPDARLVILGDADQLPSVSAGAVFRDLLPPVGEVSSVIERNCVRLTRNYRVAIEGKGGDAILALARAINAGDNTPFAASEGDGTSTIVRRDSAQQIEFVAAEWLDDGAATGAFLEHWYLKQVRCESRIDDLENHTFTADQNGFAPAECESLRRVFEKVASSQILCITRVLDSGSERINSLLHRRFAHHKGIAPDRHQFIVGEPVMMLRNDYDLSLFNGDQGVILQVCRPGYPTARMAVFPRGDNFAAFPLDTLKEHLELSYAMTVHKAQGSEFDSVAVIMPDKDIPILTREILYTAVSRARKSVTIFGTREIIFAGLSRRVERYSGVQEQLAVRLRESQRA